MISPEQFHMVSKNSVSASMGMQQKFLINSILTFGSFMLFLSCFFPSCARSFVQLIVFICTCICNTHGRVLVHVHVRTCMVWCGLIVLLIIFITLIIFMYITDDKLFWSERWKVKGHSKCKCVSSKITWCMVLTRIKLSRSYDEHQWSP